MANRLFGSITPDELRKKIQAKWPNLCDMIDDLGKDLKCYFGLENYDDDPNGRVNLSSLLGYRTLSNGLTMHGCVAGGDWEHPVFFLVYWDGRRLRAYVPTEGNPWNTTTKQAYGNDDESDLKNAKKRYPEAFKDATEIDPGDFSFDDTAIINDILARFEALEC